MADNNTSTNSTADVTAWQIAPRTLPPPAGASEEMFDSIADTPQPSPTIMQIEPQSEAEWFAVIAQMDEGKVDNVIFNKLINPIYTRCSW